MECVLSVYTMRAEIRRSGWTFRQVLKSGGGVEILKSVREGAIPSPIVRARGASWHDLSVNGRTTDFAERSLIDYMSQCPISPTLCQLPKQRRSIARTAPRSTSWCAWKRNETLPDQRLTCRRCGGPLRGREGRFILKYFLVDRPGRRALGRRAR